MRRMGVISVVLFSITAAAVHAEVLKTKSGPVNVESLTKLEFPWAMAFLPDGKLLITEKPGRLRVFSEGKLSEAIKRNSQGCFQRPGRSPRRHYRSEIF